LFADGKGVRVLDVAAAIGNLAIHPGRAHDGRCLYGRGTLPVFAARGSRNRTAARRQASHLGSWLRRRHRAPRAGCHLVLSEPAGDDRLTPFVKD
jgi:hypothetical protein